MKQLSEKQLIAIELLTSGNMTKTATAHFIGVDNSTISRWFRDETFTKEYQKAMAAYIQSLSELALKTYVHLLENAQSESVKASIAKDLISRGGYDAVAKSEVTQKTIVIDLGDEPEDTDGTEDSSETETI